jgi:uncharacterized protein YecA (UPF0149 family)
MWIIHKIQYLPAESKSQSITINRLKLFWEMIAVYCDHMPNQNIKTSTLCGKMQKFLNVTAVGTCTNPVHFERWSTATAAYSIVQFIAGYLKKTRVTLYERNTNQHCIY